MVGSDIPHGGHGAASGFPEQPKRGKGAVATVEENASTLVDVDGAMAWLRLAATGALWVVLGRNRGIVDDEERLAVILALRHERSEKVDLDETDMLYSKVSVLSRLCCVVFLSQHIRFLGGYHR